MNRFFAFALFLVLAAGLYVPNPAFGSDKPPLEEWLSRPLLAPDFPQVEIERFLDSRIPRMPETSTKEAWEQHAQRIREDMLSKVIFRGQAAQWRDKPVNVEWQEVLEGGSGYRLKKLRYEAVPGLWIPAILYEPTKLDGPAAVCLNVNGHDGNGKAADYKQLRCINQVKRGMVVLNLEWLGMGQLRSAGYGHSKMNQLDLCGTSGLAPFYLAMQKGLDVLLAHPNADPKRVAVAGLSGGGWQTIFISSLDTRVTLSNPVAGYSSFLTRIHHHSDLGDSEQTPCDMATVADYAHLTALLAPRSTLLTYNIKDNCCFASDHALPPLLAAATPIFKLYEREAKLRSHVNHEPGTHNFEQDNREALYRVLVEDFFDGSDAVPRAEIESKAEIKTAEQLQVSLPEGNADFNKLALELAAALPRDGALPTDAANVGGWQTSQREKLKGLVRFHDYPLAEEKVDEQQHGGVTMVRFRLRIAETWTIPAVVISPTEPKGSVLVVVEEGRAKAAAQCSAAIEAGKRVCAIDPFYLGESQFKSRAYLWALLVQAVGDRPVGLQASQMAAVAKWLHGKYGNQPVELDVQGERAALAGLCAAAMAPETIGDVRLRGSLASLREVIERNDGFESKPELFCFGLLESFDVKSIAALVAPRDVRFVGPNQRHRKEFAELATFYQLLGKSWKLDE